MRAVTVIELRDDSDLDKGSSHGGRRKWRRIDVGAEFDQNCGRGGVSFCALLLLIYIYENVEKSWLQWFGFHEEGEDESFLRGSSQMVVALDSGELAALFLSIPVWSQNCPLPPLSPLPRLSVSFSNISCLVKTPNLDCPP